LAEKPAFTLKTHLMEKKPPESLSQKSLPLRKNGSCARKKRTPFGICNARGKTSK